MADYLVCSLYYMYICSVLNCMAVARLLRNYICIYQLLQNTILTQIKTARPVQKLQRTLL